MKSEVLIQNVVARSSIHPTPNLLQVSYHSENMLSSRHLMPRYIQSLYIEKQLGPSFSNESTTSIVKGDEGHAIFWTPNYLLQPHCFTTA